LTYAVAAWLPMPFIPRLSRSAQIGLETETFFGRPGSVGMNSISSARRIFQILAATAIGGIVALTLGVALDTLALPLFSIAACALSVLIVARDYAPRRSYANAATAPVHAFPTLGARLPLAA
jgi:hypothetical protein